MEVIYIKFKRLCINGFNTNYEISKSGIIRHIITKHVKSYHKNHSGYYMVNIYCNKKWYLMAVHRLVAMTYIPNPEHKLEVNHIDGIKSHNNVANLEWATRDENVHHAYLMGLNVNKYGFDSRHNIYTQEQITDVINHLKSNPTNMSAIARETGVPVDTIFLIKTGRRYKDLSILLGFEPIPAKQRFDFTQYHDYILRLIKQGYSSKQIRDEIPITVSTPVYDHYIRKVRKSLII